MTERSPALPRAGRRWASGMLCALCLPVTVLVAGPSGTAIAGEYAAATSSSLHPAGPHVSAPPPPSPAGSAATPSTVNGTEIYRQLIDGLADPDCAAGNDRWRKHYAHAPRRLASRDDKTLALLGYVTETVRSAGLPTEYALIPFIESGYKPDARSAEGPAGMWQMIARTARNHRVPIRKGHDGRLSPTESTEAATRYLRKLHRMFGGNWQLAAMAYNAGEGRVLAALKRSGLKARDARPEQLQGLPPVTRDYVRKMSALSCLMTQADDRKAWREAIDRPVPRWGDAGPSP